MRHRRQGPFKVRTARIAIDFFDELEQPLVAGRGFDSRDLEKDAGTIIVNTTFAQRAFGSTNPIGRRVRQATSDGSACRPLARNRRGRRAHGSSRTDAVTR